MSDDHISMRQVLTLLFSALLSPAIRLLPGRTAEAAGTAAWLTSLAALPVLLGLCWVLFSLLRPAEGKPPVGLAGVLVEVFGRPVGKTLCVLYLLWGVFLLCANTRLVALRFLSTSYRNAPLGLFMVVLLAVTLWLTLKPVRVLAQVGEIFYLALAIGLGAALFFGAFQIQPRNVLPVWVEDVPGVLSGAVPVLGLLGYAVFAAFMSEHVRPRAGDRRHALRWAAVFCVVLTALQLVCLGSFGPGLTIRMDSPFFMMIKGIGVEGTFQRVESLFISLWVLSDLALLAFLTSACASLVKSTFAGPSRRWGTVVIVIVVLLGALLLFPDVFLLDKITRWIILPGNLIFGFLLPALTLLTKRLRRQV